MTSWTENRPPVDRVVLVAAPGRAMDAREAEDQLEELERLTDTAGGKVVSILRQRLEAPNPRYYIGEGKARELEGLVERSGATLVIFDEELTPAQGKNLEDLLGVRVMDRTELILDIFATRARTREAKLQVELAQLEYLLPRLRRMWTHLSRIRGGIGLRGPGETQLETDRRMISARIADLKVKLKDVAQARAVQRKGRQGEYRAALVGYTNVGKSSLLQALSGRELFVENRLFATLDPATRVVELGSGYRALVTDTVGFIRKLPHHLIASFRSTLEEAREADLLLHVLDASDREWEAHRNVVQDVLEQLELSDRPQLLVFNKTDRLTHAEEAALRERVREVEPSPAVFLSAHQASSLEVLREALRARVRSRFRLLHLRVPKEDGETLASLYREGEVLARRDDGTQVEVAVRVSVPTAARLARREGVELLSQT